MKDRERAEGPQAEQDKPEQEDDPWMEDSQLSDVDRITEWRVSDPSEVPSTAELPRLEQPLSKEVEGGAERDDEYRALGAVEWSHSHGASLARAPARLAALAVSEGLDVAAAATFGRPTEHCPDEKGDAWYEEPDAKD